MCALVWRMCAPLARGHRSGYLLGVSDAKASDEVDVAVIGAGVVGCAIARELARYRLRTVLIDAAAEVGDGTSKANTAILHTGFDATPGTIEARLVRRGYDLLGAYAADTGIPVERVGALLVAWDDDQVSALPALARKAVANGYLDAEQLEPAELYRREPHLGPGALGALAIPGEAIICPWSPPVAFATQAVAGGVAVRLSTRVVGIDPGAAGPTRWHALRLETLTGVGRLRARVVVNAAGLGADVIDRWMGGDDDGQSFEVAPRRGQLIVFDKFARALVNHIVLPVPTALGKGVLVAPTVFGNVMLGPTAEPIDDPADAAVTAHGVQFLLGHGARIMPELAQEEVTTVYAGVRAAARRPDGTACDDYQLRAHPARGYVCVGGIRSTGLTSALAIAEEVSPWVAAALVDGAGDAAAALSAALSRPRPLAPVTMPMLGEAFVRPYQDGERVARDGEYGHIVCHCEKVSRGEIRDALTSLVPPSTVDGLRRRTRVLMGRCQGFYCGAEVQALLAAAKQDH